MLKIVETFGRSGLHPEPRWGSSQRSPEPLARGERACCPSPKTPAPLSASIFGHSVLDPMKNPEHALVRQATVEEVWSTAHSICRLVIYTNEDEQRSRMSTYLHPSTRIVLRCANMPIFMSNYQTMGPGTLPGSLRRSSLSP